MNEVATSARARSHTISRATYNRGEAWKSDEVHRPTDKHGAQSKIKWTKVEIKNDSVCVRKFYVALNKLAMVCIYSSSPLSIYHCHRWCCTKCLWKLFLTLWPLPFTSSPSTFTEIIRVTTPSTMYSLEFMWLYFSHSHALLRWSLAATKTIHIEYWVEYFACSNFQSLLLSLPSLGSTST